MWCIRTVFTPTKIQNLILRLLSDVRENSIHPISYSVLYYNSISTTAINFTGLYIFESKDLLISYKVETAGKWIEVSWN